MASDTLHHFSRELLFVKALSVVATRRSRGAASRRPCRQQDIVFRAWSVAVPPVPDDLSVRTTVFPAQLTGPVRFDWLAAVARIAGRSKVLHLAMALAWLSALHARPDVPLTRRTMARWGLSRDAAGDGLRFLQSAGLLRCWSAPGRARIVILYEPGGHTPLTIG